MSQHERKYFVEEMQRYLEEEKLWLRNTLESIGWNVNDLESLATNAVACNICPLTSEHQTPESTFHDQIPACEKMNDYHSSVLANIDVAGTTMNKDKETVIANVDAAAAEDSNQMDNGRGKSKTDPQSSSCSMDYVQLLEAERNAKRRKLSHRGKKVCTKKNNYNETLKELIENEMKTFENSCQNETETMPNAAPKRVPQYIQKMQFCYMGIGNVRCRGNPFKRWQTVEKEEEQRSLNSINVETNSGSLTAESVDSANCTRSEKISRSWTRYDRQLRTRKRSD